MYSQYSSKEFEEKFTYTGTDLGSVWSENATSFRLWAPTADSVSLKLYQGGDWEVQDLIAVHPMVSAENGTWTITLDGNLNGVYYTYEVTIGEYVSEAQDPYAHAVGINGNRSMVIDLTSTNPEGWEKDADPNAGISETDCVIYELHVRDLSANASSGIQNKGKFLGLTENGTTTKKGHSTGLDHIKDLGVTHIQLLPIYDYASIDERIENNKKYNWGYDPSNYNVPEGSYSSNPYDGAVRIRELKQLISTLHSNGFSVVMDVVYNHVYRTYDFCINKLVPGYFSRQDKSGKLSNGSGCGNDTASERSMVRKFIVDSVAYWVDEYHIDGFRFDLAGLIDTETVQQLMQAVKAKHPHVLFWGEGWSMTTQPTKPNVNLATQRSADILPGFGFFNDTIRDTMRGSVFFSDEKGFVSGEDTSNELLLDCFCGRTEWSHNPRQILNYVSCHDNHTLYDRIAEALPEADHEALARRCRLAAAFNLLSAGIPFFQAGEEMLRSKKSKTGKYIENSYRSSDYVNSIKWNNLNDPETAKTLRYYKGLLSLRRKYKHFRMNEPEEIKQRISALPGKTPSFLIHGNQDRMLCVFNPAEKAVKLELPIGEWDVLLNEVTAGTEAVMSVSGELSIPPLAAYVLLQHRIR